MKTLFIFGDNYYFSDKTEFFTKQSLLDEFGKCVGFDQALTDFYSVHCITNFEMTKRLGGDVTSVYYIEKILYKSSGVERSYTLVGKPVVRLSSITLNSGELVPLLDGMEVDSFEDAKATIFQVPISQVDELTEFLRIKGLENFIVISSDVKVLTLEEFHG